VLVLPGILGGKATRQRAIDRTEAIASWTEMIRDSIVAASGLEEAIVATANVAPAPIASEVRPMVRRLDHERSPTRLVAFGEDLNHPSGDLVVAALVIASRMEASRPLRPPVPPRRGDPREKLGCASASRSAGPESAPPPR
jgi:tight adherence protein B